MDILISGNEQILQMMTLYVPGHTKANELELFFKNKYPKKQEQIADDCLYKPSIFNYCTNGKNGPLIYNTLYNSLVRLTSSEQIQYMKGICTSKRLKKRLIENGLWIRKDIDELDIYLSICGELQKQTPHTVNLTIATTLKCNAHCSYCYEKGIKQTDMFEGGSDRIIQFIQTLRPFKTVNLIWFGGEPLMNIPLIDDISRRLSELEINFSASMITNGSLFSIDILENKIKTWNLHDVQITLDGSSGIYEKIKNYDKTANISYFHILNSIKLLAEKGITVHIRMNISRTNMENIYELVKELDFAFASQDNVVFYPAFLSGLHEHLTDKEKLDCICKIFAITNNPQKFTAGSRFHSLPKHNACNRSSASAYTIDTHGNVYACEHNVGIPEKALGSLYAIDIIKETRRKRQFLSQKCRHCVFLPKCFGGCMADKEAGDAPCFIERYLIPAYLSLL